MSKVFNHIRYWRLKTLNVHGDTDDFRVVLFELRHLRIR